MYGHLSITLTLGRYYLLDQVDVTAIKANKRKLSVMVFCYLYGKRFGPFFKNIEVILYSKSVLLGPFGSFGFES